MRSWRLQVEEFRELVGRALGFHVDESRMAQLEEVLQRRATESGAGDPGTYLARLAGRVPAEEVRALAELLTVGETYFYRNSEQFRALAEIALPERLAASGAPPRVLSAGCASGEEPYTVAMVARECGVPATVAAFDVNPAALKRAARAKYSSWSLRETPADSRKRWFRESDREFEVAPEIRKAVAFDEGNLQDDDPRFWRPAAWDVVFCRNVIMYLKPDVARAVVARIARSLAPGGYLFLGHAETLRGLSQDFHLRHTHETFYYQSREGVGAAHAPPATVDLSSAAQALDQAPTWMEAIRDASERIASLSTATAAAPAPARDLRPVLELVGRERYADALAALQNAGGAGADPDAQLLQATLLTHAGEVRGAESLCRAVLEGNDLNAAAHYVMALCREASGDAAGAAEHDRTAGYLDAGFAMPRLHLGFLLRKSGDAAGARAEFQRALDLLPGEDASRVLLFGGGFGREALAQLCRAEIRSCEGRTA